MITIIRITAEPFLLRCPEYTEGMGVAGHWTDIQHMEYTNEEVKFVK